MELTQNRAVLDWIDQMVNLCQPDSIVWIDGSEAQLEELRAQAVATGELTKLNEEKLPGCYCTAPPPTTWLGWRTAPSSAAGSRRTPAPPTTGWTLRRCTPSSSNCIPAP